MDILLDKRNYNKIELFKILSTQETSLTLNELGQHLNLSIVSIKRSLIELEDDLNSIFDNKIKIKTSQVTVDIINISGNQLSYDIATLKLYYLKRSIRFTTLLSILQTPYSSTDELTRNLLISNSYYYKLYNELKPQLNNWGIDFNFSLKTSNLIGKQSNIRYFMAYFYWHSFSCTDWPFTNISKPSLLKSLKSLDFNTQNRLNQSDNTRFLYHLAIFFNNVIKNKDYIHLDSQSKQIMAAYQEIHDISAPVQQLITRSSIKMNAHFIENELLFFNFITRLNCTRLDSDLEKIKIGKRLANLQVPCALYSKSLVIETISFFNKDCSSDNYYYLIYITNIYCLLKFKFDIDYNVFLKKNPTKEDFGIYKSKSKKLIPLINDFILNFNSTYFDQSFSKKMNTYPELFANFIYFIILYLDTPKLSVFINYSKNIHSEKLIEIKLISIFDKKNLIITNNIKEADIILSDSPEFQQQHSSFFLIEDINEIETWYSLINYISNSLLSKHFYC